MKPIHPAACLLALLASCGGSASTETGSTAASGPTPGAGGAGGSQAVGGSAGASAGGATAGAPGVGHGGAAGQSAIGAGGASAGAAGSSAGGASTGGSSSGGSGEGGSGVGGSGAGGSSAGGSGGSSLGGVGGSGTAGVGGGTVACSKLGAPEIVAVDGDSQWQQRRVRLAPLANGRAAVVMGLDAAESPGPVPSPLAHVEFAPWGAWPTSLPLPTIVSSNGGGEVRVSQGNGSGFGLLYHDDAFQPPEPPLGLVVVPDVAEGATMVTGPLLESTEPSPPLWLARGLVGEDLDAGFLAGWAWELPLDSLHYAVRYSWTEGGGTTTVVDGLACGTSDLSADAVASGGGYLVAATTSAPFGMCGKGGVPGPDGVPHQLQIVRVDGGVATLGDELSEIGPILAVSMAPRTVGAWVVWLPSGDPAAAPPRASRVDESGKLVGTPFDVGSPLVSGAFAVGALGDRLVFAQFDTLDPSAPTIAVYVYDDAGPVAAASFSPPDGHFAEPGLSVLGSPTGDALLVAWSDQPPSGSTTSRAHVARLGCLP